MNDNENNFPEELVPEENEIKAGAVSEENSEEVKSEDVFSPVGSRDVFSHSKDEEIPAEISEDSAPAQTQEIYEGNPFDDDMNHLPKLP